MPHSIGCRDLKYSTVRRSPKDPPIPHALIIGKSVVRDFNASV